LFDQSFSKLGLVLEKTPRPSHNESERSCRKGFVAKKLMNAAGKSNFQEE
jgi:hypothetical protein